MVHIRFNGLRELPEFCNLDYRVKNRKSWVVLLREDHSVQVEHFRQMSFHPDEVVDRGSEWLSRAAGIGGFFVGVIGMFLFIFA